jgi:hypothetical protein
MDKFEPDSTYFARRATEEATAAERASDQRARQLHFELAERYCIASRNGVSTAAGDKVDEAPNAPAPLLPAEFRILP